jgi:multicomponent Na+:H+ antiporter subunit E
MRSLLLNLLVSVIWLLLQREPSLGDFAVGFSLGFGLLALFQPVLDSRDYVRRMLAALKFGAVFSREFIKSCTQLVYLILFRRADDLYPDFIIYDVAGLTRVEILLLSQCVSLTPGTNTVDISHDFTRLYLHVLDCRDPAAVRADIDRTIKNGILAFTR